MVPVSGRSQAHQVTIRGLQDFALFQNQNSDSMIHRSRCVLPLSSVRCSTLVSLPNLSSFGDASMPSVRGIPGRAARYIEDASPAVII
jgi:hypothetical protein